MFSNLFTERIRTCRGLFHSRKEQTISVHVRTKATVTMAYWWLELLDNSLRNDCQSINDIDNIMNKLQDVTETFVMDGMVSKIYNFVIDV